ncbi:hypothetical protein Leryth_014220 [Lithospermum erythrorhizon]|nr:hypothetical protein Leryth_014220 [Lithospermum erythrorhizon]
MALGGDLRGRDEIVPSSGWTEDSDCHCLLIDLPGFKKEEVKLQVDNNGHVIVSGERKVNPNKSIRFRQSYDIPENSSIDETGGKFEDEILYVLIPKKVKTNSAEEPPQAETVSNNQEQQPEQNATKHPEIEKIPNIHQHNDEETFYDAHTEMASWDTYHSLFEAVKEMLKENKAFIVTGVLAFSLGIIVSRKMQTSAD